MCHRRWLLLLPFLLCWARAAPAEGAHSRADAVGLVKRAVEFFLSHPREEALAAFDDPHGAFRDGDLYLFVQELADARVMLAHGANPGLIGMPQRDIVDADGKHFNRDMRFLVEAQGEGWISYKWPNPITRKISVKLSFVQKVNDVIIGAGVYE